MTPLLTSMVQVHLGMQGPILAPVQVPSLFTAGLAGARGLAGAAACGLAGCLTAGGREQPVQVGAVVPSCAADGNASALTRKQAIPRRVVTRATQFVIVSTTCPTG